MGDYDLHAPRYRLGKRRFYIGKFWKVKPGPDGSIRTKSHAIIKGKPLCGVYIREPHYYDHWRKSHRYDVECKRCWMIVNGGRPKLVPITARQWMRDRDF